MSEYEGPPPESENIFGKNSVTVGPVGSGAQYQSNDQTAFNQAVKDLGAKTPPGGDIWVLPDANNYSATNGVWYHTGTLIKVHFIRGAKVMPAAVNAGWQSSIASGVAPAWYMIYVVAGATDCEIHGGPVIDATTINGTDLVSGFNEGGNVTRLKVYNQRTIKATRFGRWATAYSKVLVKYLTSPSATIEQDGPVTDITHIHPSSTGCGVIGPPDGGGRKYSPNASVAGTLGAAVIQTFTEYEPIDREVIFAGHDLTSGQNPGHTMDGIKVIGGEAWATLASIPAGSDGVFVEQGLGPMTTNVKFVGHDVHGFDTGFNLSLQNNQVFADCFAYDCNVGWSTGTGVAGVFVCSNHTYTSCASFRCGTGLFVNLNAGSAGTTLEALKVKEFTVDDLGSQKTTIGLRIAASPTKTISYSAFESVDVLRVASGGVPFSTGATTGPSLPFTVFRNCPGITDQGNVATALGTVTQFDIRTGGTLPKPADTSTNTYRIRTPGLTTIAASGGGDTLTAVTAAGNPLAGMSAAGTTGTPVASTDYVSDASQTLTVSGGTGISLNVTGPDGTRYAKNLDTNVTAFGPTLLVAGTTINFGAFSVAPTTITTGLGATPFKAPITGVASFTTTVFPYNSTLQTPTNTTSSTFVVIVNSTTIANPFFGYRECSPLGGTATVTANVVYEAELMAYQVAALAGAGISITDPAGTAIGPATLTDIPVPAGLPVGFRIQASTAPTLTVSRGSG